MRRAQWALHVKADADVLIATADSAAAQACERALRNAAPALRVRHACTTTTFVTALEQAQPDAVFLSWGMSDFDTPDALDALHRLAPDAAVVAICGQPGRKALAALGKAGIVDVVAPPECERAPLALSLALAESDAGMRAVWRRMRKPSVWRWPRPDSRPRQTAS